VFFEETEAPPQQSPAGEPLELKLDPLIRFLSR
jgi:hypothetical protein